MSLKDEIKGIASAIKEDVIAKRRHLHQNPELSFKEYDTSAFIKSSLDKLDVDWKPIAGTGVLAIIKGGQGPGRVIAARADMDALPILEKSDLIFKSMNEGVMHACGHDVHTSSLLGVAEVLSMLRNQFKGTVKLIFQPAEEILPGGALSVIEENALKEPDVNGIIGQHATPSLPAGKVGLKAGRFMASMDEIRIKISGKGGHGAEPDKLADPVLASSAVILALQQVVSRFNNPNTPSVLSFGKVEAKGSVNIIPDEVFIEGTFRTVDERWREEAHERIKEIARAVAKGYGCESDINIRKGYPSLHNDEAMSASVKGFMSEYLGGENIVGLPGWMASEDFAYYSQVTEACFYTLGVGYEGVDNPSLHSPLFNVNEDAIEQGVGLMAYLIVKLLGN